MTSTVTRPVDGSPSAGARRARVAIRRVARVVVEQIAFALAARAWGVRLLNAGYRRLGVAGRGAVHLRFAGLFRASDRRLAPAVWSVPFAGAEIRLPLRADRAWLDWDAALSLLGHETAVKQTYETLLTGGARPDLFVDIGTNYGTHSILFLAAGVPTLSFEPNSSCHDFFRELCAANGVTPHLEHAALGDQSGTVDLYFPERETWLGSLNPRVIEQLKRQPGVRSERVAIRALDAHREAFTGKRVLIKIDAEDHELAVLRGAVETLTRTRPLVIFEAHRGNARAALVDFFGEHGYRIARLPLLPGTPVRLLTRDVFEAAPVSDFIAIPAERLTEAGAADGDALATLDIDA